VVGAELSGDKLPDQPGSLYEKPELQYHDSSVTRQSVDVARCARLSETHLATTQLEASGLTAEPINIHTIFHLLRVSEEGA
jgi:hypothetical protein